MNEGHILGSFPSTIQKTQHYFMERFCFVDCRGTLIIPSDFECGYGVKFLTASHDVTHGDFGPMTLRSVIIKNHVWVASFSILYNCLLEDNVVVSTGSVVTGVRIPRHCMVQGNPAAIVAEYSLEHKRWMPCYPTRPDRWTSK